MNNRKAILAAVAIAFGLAISAAPADAAWWPWKRGDKNAPAAPAEAAPAADPNAPTGGSRLDVLEEQVRGMTGQIEELTYQVQQLQDALARAQGDVDLRLQQLEGGAPRKKQATISAPATAPGMAADIPAGGVLVVNAEPTGAGLAAPAPAPVARLAPAEQPLDLAARAPAAAAPPPPPAAAAAAPKPDVMASLGDPRADYETAYNNILTGNYDRAEQAFRVFLSAHPDDQRASDAQYWLGESLFARAKYREAAIEFLQGHNSYPDGPKAPDTLLKLGLSLAGLGERDAACQTYLKVLKSYPQASKSLKQRVAVEQASASC